MRGLRVTGAGARSEPQRGEQAGVRTVFLVAVAFLLGIGVSGFWFYTQSRRGAANPSQETGGAPVIQLSDNTRAVLSRLASPLDIRFYALLDPATVPESEIAFAGRVEQLLAAYQQETGGKIRLTSVTARSNDSANAADADGIQAFNREKGEACYLGLALVLQGRKETLPRLAPEWEQVLEPDLTRAIARLEEATRPALPSLPPTAATTNAVQEVKALIPNPAAVSVEEGTRILREAALKDFTAAANEMQAQVKEAQQRLAQAQNGGSAADQQAAMKNLQQLQAQQTEKLKDIAAKSQAQIEAFQQLKAASQ